MIIYHSSGMICMPVGFADLIVDGENFNSLDHNKSRLAENVLGLAPTGPNTWGITLSQSRVVAEFGRSIQRDEVAGRPQHEEYPTHSHDSQLVVHHR